MTILFLLRINKGLIIDNSCINCVYYRREETAVFQQGRARGLLKIKHRCTQKRTCHGAKVWHEHPCNTYMPAGILKKL